MCVQSANIREGGLRRSLGWLAGSHERSSVACSHLQDSLDLRNARDRKTPVKPCRVTHPRYVVQDAALSLFPHTHFSFKVTRIRGLSREVVMLLFKFV